jgi:hypothetical protein
MKAIAQTGREVIDLMRAIDWIVLRVVLRGDFTMFATAEKPCNSARISVLT